MAEFNYSSPFQEKYLVSSDKSYVGEIEAPALYGTTADSYKEPKDIESSVKISDIGSSVTEGSRFGGSFVKTLETPIRAGASSTELSLNQGGGGEAVGAESYGLEARQAIREISRANQISFTSIHTPSNIGNLSGINQGQFNEQVRANNLDEVKKAIDFAADVGGKAVVVHTGEFQRPLADKKFNTEHGEFELYDDEEYRSEFYVVDRKTGKIQAGLRKDQTVYEPKFIKKEFNGKMEFVDADDNPIIDEEDYHKRMVEWDPKKKQFLSEPLMWDDFEKKAKELSERKYKNRDNWTPEEAFIKTQLENQILQARGSSTYYAQRLEELKKSREELKKIKHHYEDVESRLDDAGKERIMKNVSRISPYASREYSETGPKDRILPSADIQQQIADLDMQLKQIYESSSSADARADDIEENIANYVSAEKYAKEKSLNSIAQAGIHAMNQTEHNEHAKKLGQDIFVAPENIFPEMGYGSHPDELIEMVQESRKQMEKLLTSKIIENTSGRRDKDGNIIMVANPHYTGISKSEAKKEAEQHIKATFDTQHLGMWWKYFKARAGETVEQRRKRFDGWYMDQVKKMNDKNILGHIHMVDAIGGEHQHLPVGEGNLPVKKTIEYLKKNGFKGTIISEAHGENSSYGKARQMTRAWQEFDSRIGSSAYGVPTPGPTFGQIDGAYLQHLRPPYFTFGDYIPSKNDWVMWSQMPLE